MNGHHPSPDERPLETAAYNGETLVRKMKKSQKPSPVSTSQKVENFIRSAIYEGRLKPRERIIEDDIARWTKFVNEVGLDKLRDGSVPQ